MRGEIKILLLEEFAEDSEKILGELRESGISYRSKRAETKTAFLKALEEFKPDLVFSDYMGSQFEGLWALDEVRKEKRYIPFIFISWEIHEDSVIETLKKGATDYIFKEQLSRLTLSVYRALREVEEQKELEAAQANLKKSEIHFRSLIENASDVIMILDEEGVITYGSPSLERVLGYGPSELLGKNVIEFVHEFDALGTSAALHDIVEKRETPIAVEFRYKNKSGNWMTIEAIGKSIIGENGRLQIILNLRDITDRHNTEEALKENTLRLLKIQAELQKTQQKIIEQERLGALGQMASGIAHDFSNSLMPVLGFCELLLNYPENLNDRQKTIEYLKMINTSATDAKHIVGRLREFYRKRKEGEVFSPVNIKDLTEKAILLTQPRWKDQVLAGGKKITIESKLNDIEVWGNPSSLREILTNLIFNAVDAMPGDGVIRFHGYVDGAFEVLEISDTGVGMDEETQRRCFEPFFSTKGKGGTGLGLSMVYGIVRRHEGTIEVKSQAGTGTTFVIRLPIEGASTRVREVIKKEVVPLTKKLNVLVVDDESLVHRVVHGYLTSDGHTADSVMSGAEGLKKIGQKSYDLVITDWAMPEMNGKEFAALVNKRFPKTPIIMLTGFGELMKTKGDTPDGVKIILSKPLSMDELRQALSDVFSNGR